MTSTKTEQTTEGRPEGAPWVMRDAWEFLGVGERTFRRMASDGRIRVIRIGGKPMIPDTEVRRLAAEGG